MPHRNLVQVSRGVSRRLIWFCSTLLLVAGCGGSRVVVPVATRPDALVAPPDGRSLTAPAAAVRGSGAIMVKELGLPLPDEITVYVYGSRGVFERGLVHDARVSPARAAELSELAVGVGRRRQVLLQDENGQLRGREWVRLIAHELTHVAQIELAFTVLERLGLGALSQRRGEAVAGIRNHASRRAARPDLESLGTPRGFLEEFEVEVLGHLRSIVPQRS